MAGRPSGWMSPYPAALHKRTRFRAVRVLEALQAFVDAPDGHSNASDEEFAAAVALRDLIRAKQAERDKAELMRRRPRSAA